MLANRFPALISAEAAQHNEYASNDNNSQTSQQNNLMHGSSNQEKVQMSRAYGQPSNQRMYPGPFEPRQNTIEPIETPVITDANLYIKNIDYDISDETLYNVFSKLGEITSHHIVRDTMKRSRGFGFMSYRTIDQAKKAIEQANGMFIGNKPVVVMLHIKKDQRRMQKLVMKETLGSTMLPRPGGNMPSHFKMQQALHQHILHENNYNPKGRLSAMGHHTPGHHTPGHHTPGGLGYGNDHTSRGNFLARQGLAHAHDMADYPREYEREYESKSPESGYMQGQGQGQRRNLYPQEVGWDGYSNHGLNPQTEPENYMQSLGPLVPQTSPVHYFPQCKKAPSPGDMYGPMMALDKRQRVMQLRSEIYESSRAGHDPLPYEAQPNRLSAPAKNNGLWNERTGEFNAPQRGAAPPSFLQDQAQWLELGSPATTNELNFSPASWSGGLSPRGGPSSPTYENPYPPFSSHKGSRAMSPRTSYALRDSLSLNSSNHSSNQSSMIDQLPDIVSRRTSISSNPEMERPRQIPPERSFAPQGQNHGYSQFLLAEPGAQRSLLSSRLLPLVEAKSSQARKITDYLVQNAPYDELQQLLETPDLLLPHYIAAALSKMGA